MFEPLLVRVKTRCSKCGGVAPLFPLCDRATLGPKPGQKRAFTIAGEREIRTHASPVKGLRCSRPTTRTPAYRTRTYLPRVQTRVTTPNVRRRWTKLRPTPASAKSASLFGSAA